MAISFPTSLDNFTNPSSGNTLDSPSHSLQHSDINDAVEAMQRKVGVGTAVAGSASAGQVLTISAAGTSTWSTPTGPALVQIIPTSVAVGSGSGSVDANGAVTYSGASSISINGCFTSTYDNYKIILDTTASSIASDVSLKFRLSGSDLTNTYYGAFIGLTHANTQTNWTINNAAAAKITEMTNFTKRVGFVVLEVNGPFLTNSKNATWATLGVATASGTGLAGTGAVSYDTTTNSSDGISFIRSSGTMTGTIRVYGYKN